MGKKKPQTEHEAALDSIVNEQPAEKVTKSEAVRRAVAAGKDKPADAVEWIKQTFDIDIDPQHFSSVKSNLKKKEGTVSSPGHRSPKPVGSAGPHPASLDGTFEAIAAVKELVDKYGVDTVKKATELFSK